MKKTGGRPEFAPTPDQRRHVEGMSAIGISQSDIANVIGISEPTLRKHFDAELTAADVKANARVAGNLFRQATKDDFKAIPAAIFWCKTRLRWREAPQQHEVELPPGVEGAASVVFKVIGGLPKPPEES